MRCDCGSGREFKECCGPILSGEKAAGSAEALMRSRYSAYKKHDLEYLKESTDPQRRLEVDWEATKQWMENSIFTKLEVTKHVTEKNKATVEFKATFKPSDSETEQEHKEDARFRLQSGRWFFRPR